jgi:hypothetical protein
MYGKMKKSGKIIFVALGILLVLGTGVFTYLNHTPKAETFGYESMMCCVVVYLFYRPFTKRGELEVILLNFACILGVNAIILVPEWTFGNIITAWGWSAIGFLVVCAISFIARKTKLLDVGNASAEHNQCPST